MTAAFNIRLRKVVRKHRRLLTYFGALIVFATFAVRDDLREHLKDLIDEVSTADNVFAVRSDNMETRIDLGDLEKQLLVSHAVNGRPSELKLIQTKVQQMYFSLGAVSYLIETTHDKEDLQQLTVLDKELTAIRFSSLDLNHTPATVAALGSRAFALELKLAAFEDDVMKHARSTLEERRSLYDMSTWLSTVLYAIGWGLGLIGTIYGVEGVGGE